MIFQTKTNIFVRNIERYESVKISIIAQTYKNS